ncbi:hypothetical protein H6F32_13765 [Anabaena sp. FACHB-1237]|uniref:EAD6 domain-containing conflict system protein n=1 Tax=Anabaena sp. FACHB-1237 TaxID=2692769 RepID=UPI001680D895|nr:EAD6 domain-containing conflict system protein [Anabaena sp. FACHB-1237]MBD2138630.1 hypothetical protein [Anabaena sp. FACHB-1237]
MSSINKELTVVQLDLVNSSKSFQDIYTKYNLGNETLAKFIQQIEEIIATAFNQSIKNQEIQGEFTKIETALADGCRLTFESVENAYNFIRIFCRKVNERNEETGIDQWCFRIGAATGNVDYDPERMNPMISNVLVVVKELETGAFPGWLFIDEMTYNALSQEIRTNFSSQTFENKHGQSRQAYGCPMLANYVQSIRPIIWTDKNKQALIKIIKDVFTEQELITICDNNTGSLGGNPYHAISGNTVNARYSDLVNHLIKKGFIDSFLNILCQESTHFANLVESLRK